MNSATASANPELINLLDFDRKGLAAFFVDLGEKPFRATQLLKWIYHEGVEDFEQMSNLSKSLRTYLIEHCCIETPEIVIEQRASDGVRKWVLETHCGNRVETEFIPEESRGTLCVSSQVGCALACTFCSTAQQGFNRNLSVSEIIGQVYAAQKRLGSEGKITNVVMMGMGEPLLNFDNVVTAMNLMMEDFAFGLSKRRVTISTSGVVPAMYRLGEVCDVSLAVSLHAVTNALRDELVPINNKYPLEELLEAEVFQGDAMRLDEIQAILCAVVSSPQPVAPSLLPQDDLRRRVPGLRAQDRLPVHLYLRRSHRALSDLHDQVGAG